MSGQAGCFYCDRRPLDREVVETLNQDLLRYGPDRGSHRAAPGLLMVHRACNFDALSETEIQPYVSEDGLVVTFDGRLDNRSDLLLWLRDELKGEITDVALATAAYARWRDHGFARLIGDWSLAIWDAKADAVVLASDYCGVIPLYYSLENNEGIRWSSSLKGLVDWTASAEDLDESWIAAFLTGRPKFDRTVYRKIRAVPPAHKVRFSHGKITISRVWTTAVHDEIRYRDERRYEEELMHHFREAVAVRLRSNRPISCDLTGGLDSSSVTCMAHRLVKAGEVETTRAIALTELDHCTEDAHYAQTVQEWLGIEQICCNMESNWSIDPSAIGPGMSTARQKARARLLLQEGVRTNLTGGAGDLMMGNDVDDCGQIADLLRSREPHQFLVGAYRWSRALRIPIYHALLRGIVPVLSPRRQEAVWKQQQLRQSNRYQHLEQTRSCFTAQVHARQSEDLCVGLELCDWWKASPSVRRFLAIIEFQNLSRGHETQAELQPIRNSQPYTHRPMVEFLCAVPRKQLCAPGEPRRLMRRSFERLLPPQVVNRKTKALMGYQKYIEAQQLIQHLPGPVSAWSVVTRGLVDRKTLSEQLDRISRTTLHDWAELDTILALETWFASRNPEGLGNPSNKNFFSNFERR
jgi:asparagine synthase (glutamine-hydrolysing)